MGTQPARTATPPCPSLTYGDTILALQDLSALLGREVKPTIFTPQDFAKRLREGGAFWVTHHGAAQGLLMVGQDGLAL